MNGERSEHRSENRGLCDRCVNRFSSTLYHTANGVGPGSGVSSSFRSQRRRNPSVLRKLCFPSRRSLETRDERQCGARRGRPEQDHVTKCDGIFQTIMSPLVSLQHPEANTDAPKREFVDDAKQRSDSCVADDGGGTERNCRSEDADVKPGIRYASRPPPTEAGIESRKKGGTIVCRRARGAGAFRWLRPTGIRPAEWPIPVRRRPVPRRSRPVLFVCHRDLRAKRTEIHQ